MRAYVSLTTWCVLGVYGNREMPVSHPRSRVDTGWTAATAVLLAYTAVLLYVTAAIYDCCYL